MLFKHVLSKQQAFVALTACALASVASAQSMFIDTVVVGDIGNAADPLTGKGSVNYAYNIGKTEVTNAQYVNFLNHVAKTDTFGLYNANMATHDHGGILRTGTAGNYSYSVKAGYADMPVTFVSFWDAARFTNWVGTGSTEGRATQNGALIAGAAYDLNFATTPVIAQANRLAGASIYIPSENEWYKAAYYQPASAGGDADSYWRYATGSNTQPTSALPGPGEDRANYSYSDEIDNGINGGYAVTQNFDEVGNMLTAVGVYGAASESYYGTADQNGNVWEWNDTTSGPGNVRAIVGGGWFNGEYSLRAGSGEYTAIASENGNFGFRVASVAAIPEPGTYAAMAGGLALATALWRRRHARSTR